MREGKGERRRKIGREGGRRSFRRARGTAASRQRPAAPAAAGPSRRWCEGCSRASRLRGAGGPAPGPAMAPGPAPGAGRAPGCHGEPRAGRPAGVRR